MPCIFFPVDCKVGNWKPWGVCSVTCNGGTKTREREVVEEPKNGGAMCPAPETMACNTEQCPQCTLPRCLLSSGLLEFPHFITGHIQLTAKLVIGKLGANAV